MFESFRDRKTNQAPPPTEERRRTLQPSNQTAAQSQESGRRPEVSRPTPLPQSPNPVARQLEMVARRTAQNPEPIKDEMPVVDSKEGQKLVVGPRIRLKGEVSNCDMLIVEGHFEGTAKSRVLQVAQGGSYQGEAEVERAEMSGKFDGSLTVGNRLVIRTSGRVSGTIQYFGIEVEEGGQISGNIQVIADEGGGAATRAAKAEDEPTPTSHEAAS